MAIRHLAASEKGLAAGVLIVIATVFACLERTSVDAWLTYSGWIFGIYAITKTVQSGVAAIAAAKSSAWVPDDPPTDPQRKRAYL